MNTDTKAIKENSWKRKILGILLINNISHQAKVDIIKRLIDEAVASHNQQAQERLDKALDLQRVQHARTMDIILKDRQTLIEQIKEWEALPCDETQSKTMACHDCASKRRAYRDILSLLNHQEIPDSSDEKPTLAYGFSSAPYMDMKIPPKEKPIPLDEKPCQCHCHHIHRKQEDCADYCPHCSPEKPKEGK